MDEANRAVEASAQFSGTSTFAQANLAYIYARMGRIVEAENLLKQFQGLAQGTYISAIPFGIVYFALGEIDKCFDWLDKAVEEHEPIILQMAFNPLCDQLWSHPRYHALLRKMNLEP